MSSYCIACHVRILSTHFQTYSKLNEPSKDAVPLGVGASVDIPQQVIVEEAEKQMKKCVKPFTAKQKVSFGLS